MFRDMWVRDTNGGLADKVMNRLRWYGIGGCWERGAAAESDAARGMKGVVNWPFQGVGEGAFDRDQSRDAAAFNAHARRPCRDEEDEDKKIFER